MQFRCDQCGKRYSTSQEIREGRSYRFQCRRCGHEVIVRGPGGSASSAGATAAPDPGAHQSAASSSSSSSAPSGAPTPDLDLGLGLGLSPGRGGNGVSAMPPPDALDFHLDDAAVSSQQTTTAVPMIQDVAPPPPLPAQAPAADVEAPLPAPPPAPARRKPVGVLVAILVPAVLAGVAVAVFAPGSGPSRDPAPPAQVPGLLQPMVYVGPVALERPALEEPDPRGRPEARATARPARPPPRPAAKPPARKATKVAAREEPRPATAAPAAPPSAASSQPSPQAPAPQPAAQAPPAPAAPAQAAARASPPPAEPVADADDAAADGNEEEAPRYGGEGFRRPETETPRCVESNVRLPRDLAGRLPPAVTLRFAVGRDGSADRIQVLGDNVNPTLATALQAAVRGCRFRPGADETGRPIRLWVVMPLRFAQ